MRVLLDECLPRSLVKEIHFHDVSTVHDEGWRGKKNGELLKLAESKFDVFVTVDQNLQYQQNLKARTLSIILLVVKGNHSHSLMRLVPKIKIAPRQERRPFFTIIN